jgi:hypothetical protein
MDWGCSARNRIWPKLDPPLLGPLPDVRLLAIEVQQVLGLLHLLLHQVKKLFIGRSSLDLCFLISRISKCQSFFCAVFDFVVKWHTRVDNFIHLPVRLGSALSAKHA